MPNTLPLPHTTTHEAAAAVQRGTSSETRALCAVVAAGLTLHGRRGLVYGPVDLTVPVGGMLIVQGAQGAGRSSLLLTLAGRMVPDHAADLERAAKQG